LCALPFSLHDALPIFRPPLCRASSAKPGSAFPDLEGAVMRFDAAVVVAAAHVSGEVVPARAQMAATLGFHIILACLGIAFPTIRSEEHTSELQSRFDL